MMRAFTYGSSMRAIDAGVGELRRALEQLHRAVGVVHVVLDVRHGGDEVQIELALEPLLDDLHVQQAEKAAAESEAERGGRLRQVVQGGVVELQLLERVAQRLVLRACPSDRGRRTPSSARPCSPAAARPRGAAASRIVSPARVSRTVRTLATT